MSDNTYYLKVFRNATNNQNFLVCPLLFHYNRCEVVAAFTNPTLHRIISQLFFYLIPRIL
jgi:hypothetical protein